MKRAFTLIELLIVISIIALLIGILLPALGAAHRSGDESLAGQVIGAILIGPIHYPYLATIRAQIAWQHVFTAAVGVGVLGVTLHRFCLWLRHDAPAAKRWHWRWTLTILAALPMLFLLCLAPVAIMDHLRWLIVNERPAAVPLPRNWSGVSINHALASLCRQTSLAWTYTPWDIDPDIPPAPGFRDSTILAPLEQIHFVAIRRPDRSLSAVVLAPRDEVDRHMLGLRIITKGKGDEEANVAERPGEDWPQIIETLQAAATFIPPTTTRPGVGR